MSVVIPKNTATAAERRLPIYLVDATDKDTPEDISTTGVKASLSFGGGTFANSTNDITKVSGTFGEYYIELTQTEANNAVGPVAYRLQPSGCAIFRDVAMIGPSTALEAGSTIAEIVAGVFERAFDATKMSGLTFEQIIGLTASVLLGKASGLATTTATYRNLGDTADAVVGTVDTDGNRSAVTRTASAVV